MKLGYTILYVDDVLATTTFYEKAFGLTTQFIAPGDEYAEMQTGSTTLSFAKHSLIEPQISDGYLRSNSTEKPFGMEIGFITDDVDASLKQSLLAGAILVKAAEQKPWGQTVAYVRDCNGFLVELCTRME